MPLPSSAVTDPCKPPAMTRLEPINRVPSAIVVFLMIFRYMCCFLHNYGRFNDLPATSSGFYILLEGSAGLLPTPIDISKGYAMHAIPAHIFT
jgi:hypothetical protein